jgi:hypothetical protein
MHLTIRKYRKVLGDKKQLVDLVNRELARMLAGTSGPVTCWRSTRGSANTATDRIRRTGMLRACSTWRKHAGYWRDR